MTLLLSDPDVKSLLSMRESVECIENCFSNIVDQTSENFPRTRAISPTASLQVMYALLPFLGRAGSKLYTAGKGKATFVAMLFDLKSCELLSIIGASTLGKYRTGAASAVATKYLTRMKSFKFGIAGTGGQALAQVSAQLEIANIESVAVWSPSREHRETFCRELSRNFGLDSHPSESVEDAFSRSDIATAITSAKDPFVTKAALTRLTHLNACGANNSERAELATEALEVFDTICVDDRRQAKTEARELMESVASGRYNWESFVELKDIVQSKVKTAGRTMYKSLGIAAEDVALASLVYDKAVGSGTFDDRRFNF